MLIISNLVMVKFRVKLNSKMLIIYNLVKYSNYN